MNRFTVLGFVLGIAIGLLLGYQWGNAGRVTSPPLATAPGLPAGMPPGMPQGSAPMPMPTPGAGAMDVQARITAAQQIVARDPKNVRAWIGLGNDYFDSRQSQKAIEAYGRALELAPNDPDVLTDQGVMYRDTGNFEKAIENFKKASTIDPKHVHSLFNLGVVYAHDLKNVEEAKKAWNRVIAAAPGTPAAAQAQQALQQLQANPPTK